MKCHSCCIHWFTQLKTILPQSYMTSFFIIFIYTFCLVQFLWLAFVSVSCILIYVNFILQFDPHFLFIPKHVSKALEKNKTSTNHASIKNASSWTTTVLSNPQEVIFLVIQGFCQPYIYSIFPSHAKGLCASLPRVVHMRVNDLGVYSSCRRQTVALPLLVLISFLNVW